LGNCFVRVPREPGEGGKGSYWIIHPDYYKDIQPDGSMKRSRTPGMPVTNRSRKRVSRNKSAEKLGSAHQSGMSVFPVVAGAPGSRSKVRRVVSAPNLQTEQKDGTRTHQQAKLHRSASTSEAIHPTQTTSTTHSSCTRENGDDARHDTLTDKSTTSLADASITKLDFLSKLDTPAVNLMSISGDVNDTQTDNRAAADCQVSTSANSSVATLNGLSTLTERHTSINWADACIAAPLPQMRSQLYSVQMGPNEQPSTLLLPIWNEYSLSALYSALESTTTTTTTSADDTPPSSNYEQLANVLLASTTDLENIADMFKNLSDLDKLAGLSLSPSVMLQPLPSSSGEGETDNVPPALVNSSPSSDIPSIPRSPSPPSSNFDEPVGLFEELYSLLGPDKYAQFLQPLTEFDHSDSIQMATNSSSGTGIDAGASVSLPDSKA
jgi:hypothetical protein